MNGRIPTVVISGATSGIGEVTALTLAAHGARIVFIARDQARADSLLVRLQLAHPGAMHCAHLADLTQLSSVKRVTERIRATEPVIDTLVANAGAVFISAPPTAEGFSRTFALNHLAVFVLILGLIESLRAAPAARIIVTSSRAHRFGRMHFDDLQQDGLHGYAQSKLANLLFTTELARRLGPGAPTVNALHPGFVASRFADETPWPWRALMHWRKRLTGLTVEEGARTLLWLASDPGVANITGGYFADCTQQTPWPQALDENAAARLWQKSVDLTGLDLTSPC